MTLEYNSKRIITEKEKAKARNLILKNLIKGINKGYVNYKKFIATYIKTENEIIIKFLTTCPGCKELRSATHPHKDHKCNNTNCTRKRRSRKKKNPNTKKCKLCGKKTFSKTGYCTRTKECRTLLHKTNYINIKLKQLNKKEETLKKEKNTLKKEKENSTKTHTKKKKTQPIKEKPLTEMLIERNKITEKEKEIINEFNSKRLL